MDHSYSQDAKSEGGYFAEDDYGRINDRYFKEILSSQSWSALPVGWLNSAVDAASLFTPPPLSMQELAAYAVDESRSLDQDKTKILELLSAWEGRSIEYDEATLCPSVSTATAVTLSALKARGIRNVIFETPAYFATVDQANALGLNAIQVPTFRSERFHIPTREFKRMVQSLYPCALWLTHPRFVISINRSMDEISAMTDLLRSGDFLVIDEAAEQSFPTVLGQLINARSDRNIIRIRGMVKGIGLNGMRLAVILHSKRLRREISAPLDANGASLDRFSLAAAKALAAEPALFQQLLNTSRSQVQELNKMALDLSRGSLLSPFRVENGYMSAVMLDIESSGYRYEDFREALLNYCQDIRMPVVLRSSMNMAFDPSFEAIRINYFTSRDNIRVSLENLRGFYQQLR